MLPQQANPTDKKKAGPRFCSRAEAQPLSQLSQSYATRQDDLVKLSSSTRAPRQLGQLLQQPVHLPQPLDLRH